ncbi:MAG: hypothetical protein HRT61_16145, partial [Ekhidna sp.]|nr:hypothetical protein [Ekhidna sp.]
LNAQEEVSYSNEDLQKYAKVMIWAEYEKERMTKLYNGWIDNDDNMKSARFVEIRDAKGDSVKMGALAVSQSELSAFALIQNNYDSMTASFRELYIGKIKEEIGASLYNSLNKSLKSEEDLRQRYSRIQDSILERKDDSSEEIQDLN